MSDSDKAVENVMGNWIIKIVLGLLTSSVIALFGWVWNAQSTLTKLSIEMSQIKEKMIEISADSAADNRQDSQLSKHWRLHSWSRQKINELETKSGIPISAWPDLD